MSETNGTPDQPRATGEHILVRQIEVDATDGGIALPEGSAQRIKAECYVVDVGPGLICLNGDRVAPDVNVGDLIWIYRREYARIPLPDGGNLIAVRSSDIVAKIPAESAA
jgi:co-chaperonin GroES (HSP10)